MTRAFTYNFAPPSLDPSSGATTALDVSEIEDADIREVLQTPAQPMRVAAGEHPAFKLADVNRDHLAMEGERP
jgi:hypothetical protein